MATVKCVLKKRGRPSVEWTDEQVDHIYCCGYIDASTESLLPECWECADNVNKAQYGMYGWKAGGK